MLVTIIDKEMRRLEVETLQAARDFSASKEKEKVVVLLSGGMDSTTLLYYVKAKGFDVYVVNFFYGQKHKKEIYAAWKTCDNLGVPYNTFDLEILGKIAPSALTRDTIDIPKGHYAEESMRATVVPNRNMVLLSLAVSYAIGIGAKSVWYGAHGGDHAIYPDCRPEFILRMGEVIRVCDWSPMRLEVPFMLMSKAMILKEGIKLGVDYSMTTTCYEGREKACGRCGSCVERLEAFQQNNIKDPLRYE